MIELSSIQASLGAAARFSDLDAQARAAVDLMIEADGLVLATPGLQG